MLKISKLIMVVSRNIWLDSSEGHKNVKRTDTPDKYYDASVRYRCHTTVYCHDPDTFRRCHTTVRSWQEYCLELLLLFFFVIEKCF